MTTFDPKECAYCGIRVDFLDEEMRDSFCSGSRYGTHRWEDPPKWH